MAAASTTTSVATPVLAWRPRSTEVPFVGEEDCEPTVRIPEFAQNLARSIGEDQGDRAPSQTSHPEVFESGAMPVGPESSAAGGAGAVVATSNRPPHHGTRRVRAVIVAALAATLVAPVLALIAVACAHQASEPAARHSDEAAVMARAAVGCPAPPLVTRVRATEPSPVWTPNHAARRAAPAVAPRAIARFTAPRRAPRGPLSSAIVRTLPF